MRHEAGDSVGGVLTLADCPDYLQRLRIGQWVTWMLPLVADQIERLLAALERIIDACEDEEPARMPQAERIARNALSVGGGND